MRAQKVVLKRIEPGVPSLGEVKRELEPGQLLGDREWSAICVKLGGAPTHIVVDDQRLPLVPLSSVHTADIQRRHVAGVETAPEGGVRIWWARPRRVTARPKAPSLAELGCLRDPVARARRDSSK